MKVPWSGNFTMDFLVLKLNKMMFTDDESLLINILIPSRAKALRGFSKLDCETISYIQH